jgi:GNAT superfamily N-acetyltransferase
MMDTGQSGGTIVTVEPGNVEPFLEHLLRLDPEARLHRFWYPASDADVCGYVGGLDMDRVKLIGFLSKGALRGAVELTPAESAGGRVLDAAVSVEQAWQGRGVATALLLRAIAVARGMGALYIRVAGLADTPRLRRALGQFEVDLLFKDDDCQAWLPLGNVNEAKTRQQSPAVVR